MKSKVLSKVLALAVMVPALLIPSMTKAASLPLIPNLRPIGIDRDLIIIPQSTATDDEIDTDAAKSNYSVNFSPSVENYTYTFNHTDKKVLAVVIDEKDENISTITAVKMEIRNDNTSNLVASYQLTSAYGQFAKILDLTTLNLDSSYTVSLTVNTNLELSSGGTMTLSDSSNILTLIGEGTSTDDNSDDNTDDTTVEVDNHNIVVLPAGTDGIYEFNHDDKDSSIITVSEADYNSALEIDSVKINVKNIATNSYVISTTSSERNSATGAFIINLDLNLLNVENTYAATAVITYYNTDTNAYSTKTYDVIEYRGEEEDSAVSNDEVDNYDITINKETTTTNNQEVYYFKTTDSKLTLSLIEEDRSSSALNEITRVKYYVRNIDNDNRLVQVSDITEANSSTNGYYILNIDLANLNSADRYEVEALISYVDTDNDSHVYTRSYDILRLVPKSSSDSDYSPEDLDNVNYNINKALVNYDGTNLYLYDENELTNINTYQNTYGSNAPQVVSMTYLLDGSSIKNCEDESSCNLQYELPLNDEVSLSVRVNYEYFDSYADRYHRYSKIYDLGRHLRIDGDDNSSDDNSTDNDTDTNTDLATLNDFILVKGSTPSVYLVNKYNNRFYIPDWSVLKSWFYQPNIVQINDSQLAQYTLKDNVIYRPGSLIKIATDPKCYAVDLDGTLRWVYNENVARAIFGTNWNKNIYTVPDSLFPSYSFGETIYDAADYDMPSLTEAIQMYNVQ